MFFALGKYADAAGVLNPVLASGPGWGWDTMVAFYNDSESYKAQLAKLEEYTKSTNKGDGHFLLGYHYLVCGYMEESNAEFAKAAELEPNDSISAQLRDLTANSIDTEGQEEPEPEERPDPVPADKLVGSWTSENETGKVTFEMKESGDFTWKFAPKSGDSSEFSGTYGLDEQGLLVMTSDDTQMVSVVEMKEPDQLHFALVGAPDGDPGLDFRDRGVRHSGQNILNDLTVNIGEAEVASAVAVGQGFVIEAQKVEKGGVEVVDVDLVLHGGEAEVIGGTMNVSTLDPSAGHPGGKSVVVVVASVDLASIGSGLGHFDYRSTPKFSAPDYHSFVEETSLFEVRQKSADRLITFTGKTAVVLLKVVMIIPGLSCAIPNLNKANSTLHETAGDQHLSSLKVLAIHFANVFGLQ